MVQGKAPCPRRLVVAASLVAMLPASVACRKTDPFSRLSDAEAPAESTLAMTPGLTNGASYALDEELIEESGTFFGSLFGKDYETNFDKLAALSSASVDPARIPYSDSAYPEGESSPNARVARRPMMEALAKYDAAFHGGQSLAADWEKANHADGSVSWYGHCNGFSAASSRHQDPQQSVYRPKSCRPGSAGCVEFQTRDIRALLAEVYMNATSRFLAGDRCDIPKEKLPRDPQNRANPLVMDECEDVNPGGFHVALVNWIGLQKQVLLMDLSRDIEVWNYPVYSYSIRYPQNGRRLSRQDASGLVGRRRSGSDYPFNPKAKSFVVAEATIVYSQQLGYQPNGPAPTKPLQSTYQYLLELDDKGNIMGGEWLGDSRLNHPDFVWIPFEPFDPPGNRRYGNKHVSPHDVISLWAESMGFDPEKPFADPKNPNKILTTPADQGGWGRMDGFHVVIDGNGAGVAFLGKKTTLRLQRQEKLQGDVRVAVTLDGKPLATLSGQADKDITTAFDAPQGFHALGFTWSKADGKAIDASGTLRFFARP